MTAETKIIIAFLFKRSGKTALKDSELYLPLSMELGWFSTKEAQVVIQQAVEKKLLVSKEGLLHPSFDVQTVEIPVGFTPSKKILTKTKTEEKKEDVVDLIVGRLVEHTQREPSEIRDDINHAQKEKNLTRDVAALYVAKKYDLDVNEFYSAIEERLLKEKKG